MGRKSTVHRNLPPGMRARPRGRKIFYSLDRGGKPRKEIYLGSDYPLAMRKYAELIQNVQPAPEQRVTFNHLAERYKKDVIPEKAPYTQTCNIEWLAKLILFFSNAPLEEIKPQHVAQYRDWRVKETRKRLLQLKRAAPPKAGAVSANRELSLFSNIWNKGREWGYTDQTNPCLGIRKHKERGREVYIDDALYKAVWEQADEPLRDAMDLAWLTGQRPADVLKLCETDIKDGALWVTQGKTGAKLRIEITGKLAATLERIRARKAAHRIRTLALICNEQGEMMGKYALRCRFDRARAQAGVPKAAFHFRDLRAKAATEKEQSAGMAEARRQLGHTSENMTRRYVRNRLGDLVTPTE